MPEIRRLLPTTCFLLLLAGCATAHHAADDPLLGGPLPPAGRPSPGPPAGSVPSADGRGERSLPPLPIYSSSTSTAALAAGSPPAFDAGRDLRIADAGVKPGDGPGAGPRGGATLRRPEPVVPAAATGVGGLAPPGAQPITAVPVAREAVPRSPGPAGGAGGLTYEQAQAQLAARGVTWQRLETWGDHGWKFSCSIPNRHNRSLSRTYEAKAADDLGAIRAVLEQIDKER
jgi:hypothetical protein